MKVYGYRKSVGGKVIEDEFPLLWLQEIQDTLLPPSVHIYPKKKGKASEQLNTNGGIQQNEDNYKTALSPDVPVSGNQGNDNSHVRKSAEFFPDVKNDSVASSSPYPNVCSLQLCFVFPIHCAHSCSIKSCLGILAEKKLYVLLRLISNLYH